MFVHNTLLKKWGLNIGLTVASLLMCLGIVEIGLRLFFPDEQLLYTGYQFSPTLLWVQKPYARYTYRRPEFTTPMRYNSAGFRDAEYPLAKAPGVFRIAVLGDSFTEAREVPLAASYPKVLEQRLNTEAGKKTYEVLNFGAVRYGTDQYLLRLQEQALAYHPDLIVVGMYANDFVDNLKGLVKLDARQQLELHPRLSFGQKLALKIKYYYIGGSLYSVEFLIRRLAQLPPLLQKWKAAAQPPPGPATPQITGSTGEMKPGRNFPLDIQIYLRQESAQCTSMYRLQEALLQAIKEVGEQAQIPTVLVLFPEKFQLYASDRQQLERQHQFTAADYDVEKPQQALARFAAAHKLPFLDLLPVFRRAGAEGPRLYFVIDGHINEAGHRVAAEAIFELLRSKQLLSNIQRAS